MCFYGTMFSFKEKISEFVKKNIILCFLASFALGGLIVFFALEKRVHNEYVVEAESEQGKEGEDNIENQNIFGDLSGAVNKPGVYELENGARVADLLSLAGGITGDSSAAWVSRNLNLSKVLQDSSKIYIPFEWEFYFPESYQISKTVNKNYASDTGDVISGNSDTDGSSSGVDMTDVSDGGGGDTADSGGVDESGKINVNTASSSELDSLPGIGPAYAEKIISNRPYNDLKELESKSGLYKSTIENIKDMIVF
jgi:competence protein ComEA